MAIFHYDLRPVSRREGDSTIRAWAYATGTCQVDARTGLVHDWSKKAAEILATGKVGPADWQASEKAETRWNSKTGRTLMVALPHEMSLKEQRRLMRHYAAWLRRWYGLAAEWAIHRAPDDPRNVHGHFVFTTRVVDDQGRHGAKLRDLDCPKTSGMIVMAWREAWEQLSNGALEKAAVQARIDARSLAARGIHRPARVHLGREQTEQQRNGYHTAASRHNARVDEIERLNAELYRITDEERRLRRKRRLQFQRRRRRAVAESERALAATACVAHLTVRLVGAAAGRRGPRAVRRRADHQVAQRAQHQNAQPERGHGADGLRTAPSGRQRHIRGAGR
ncbi:MAG: MobA/MobL family protein [Rhodospirillales bacterium]|nr:MobA/MobL family protein [Acetobacter sp.]